MVFTKKDNYSRCKHSALYSLAMREHSRQEIYNKLTQKKFSKDIDLDKLLDELEDNNYLSDSRFAESFIRYQSNRGKGKIKIANDLRKRGVNNAIISSSLYEANIDWYELAKEQREKKFGDEKPENYKEKTRQMRFLSGRGFDHDIIRQVVA